MEIQLIIMSIITYLVMFNSCLTFRLTVVNNMVITMIIAVNMVFIGNQVGSLFVLPMLSLLILYVIWLKREQWLINVVLIVFSYTLLVIVDNLTHFIWVLAGLDIQIHWPLYMLIDYPIFYVLCRLLSKKAVKIQEQEFIKLSPKILAVLGADLILFMLIFILHITMVEQAGSTLPMIFSSVLLYIAYFLLTLLMITTLVREYEKNAKILNTKN